MRPFEPSTSMIPSTDFSFTVPLPPLSVTSPPTVSALTSPWMPSRSMST
jgi:hypothetical protein